MKLFNRPVQVLCAIILSFCLLTFTASEIISAPGIYKTISFQGKLQDDDGLNVADGNYSIVFTLYDASSGGSNLWDETQTVAVADGVFQVNLGSVDTTIAAVDFDSDSIYLGVKVEADSEMTPRIRFSAVPYAFNAEKVSGLTVTNTTGTFTLANLKTFEVANSLSFSGTDLTAFTFPTGSGTVVTNDSTVALTNKTLTAPRFADGGFIADASGNELLIFDSNASAVNELTLSNAATGNAVVLGASGETNVGLTINSKATGALTLDSGTTGLVNLGTGNNAKTINLGTGTAGNILNIGTNNTTSDTITIGSLLDNVAITSDSWSITDSGALTVASCTGCGSGGTSYFSPADGLLSTVNSTLDFSVGGTSTATAKFAVINVNSGSPTASLSAGTSGGLYMTAGGTVATTANQALNLGNATTGAVNVTSGATLGISVATGNSSTIADSGALSLATGSSTSGSSGLISILTGNGAGSAGSISQVGTTKTASNNLGVASQAITFDSIPQDGDIILITAASDSSPAPSAPAGFTEVFSDPNVDSNGDGVWGWYKRASGEVSATYTVTFAGTNYRESVMGMVFRGAANTGNPFEVATVGSPNFNATPVAPDITTLTDNAWHMAYFWINEQDMTATSPPAGYTKLGGVGVAGQLLAYKVITPPGATGTTTITGPGAQYNIAASLSLKPGVTGGSSGDVQIGTGTATEGLGSGGLDLSTGGTETGASGDINIITGAASGAGTSGNLSLDVGSVSGGTLGTINIGTTNAQTLNLGKTGSANTITGASLALAVNSVTYTWPTSAPAGNGYVLSSTTGGTLSWVSVAGGSQTPWTSDIDGDNYSLLDLGTNITSRNGLTLGTGSNGMLTIAPDGSGNLILGADFDSGVTIGSAISGEFPLLVRSGIGSNAALAVDQLNSGDIFTASASGVTKFRVNNSGQVFLEDGSAGSPAVTFGNDTNTGFYRQGADLFSFVANGQNALNLDGTSGVGRLMVGDGSPVSRIQINDDNNNAASGLTLGGTGSTDVQIFKSASNTLTIDASSGTSFNGGLTFTGATPSVTINSGEVLSITDGTDSISFDTTNNFFRVGDATNGLTFDIDSGPTYTGTARMTKAITLSPEYSGAVITAFYGAGTDTNIVGSMTSDADTTQGTSIRNYYQWERTTDATQHFYTVAVRVTLPADFSAWATSNAVTVAYKTESATNTVSDLDVRIYNENSATIVASSADNASTSWTTVAIDDSTLDDNASSEWDAAGETAVIYLRMGSASSNYVQVGDITLNYLSKF